MYENRQWEHIISHWKKYFCRANVVVFPDYSLPMLYSVLDTGNFFVIPGSPVDVWAAESYIKTHSKLVLRKENAIDKDNMLVLVIGGSSLYDELPWDHAFSMHDLEPLLIKYARREEGKQNFKFVFLSGNSSTGYDATLQDFATRLGLHEGSLKLYGIDNDANDLILMADIILYCSSQEEPTFPGLLMRAMTFRIPIVALENPVIKHSVSDRVQEMIVPKHNSDVLLEAFALLLWDEKLSKFGHSIASAGRLRVEHMLASQCIATYARLIESVFNFPSNVLLPGNTSQLKQSSWEWNAFQKKMDLSQRVNDAQITYSVVQNTKEQLVNLISSSSMSGNDSGNTQEGLPTNIERDVLRELKVSEELANLEMEEIDERMEKQIGDWDELYRDARKSEKLRFEIFERDEGELERTGQPLSIYEIYLGPGAWKFLHHGSLYRGLSLSTLGRRLSSDDLDAVEGLPVLNDTYVRDIICEMGGMFSIAKGVDYLHKRPWIGFQSWRVTGRKATLSSTAESVLEDVIQKNSKGDVIYFWGKLDMDGGFTGNNVLTFWSMCDILNGGNCRIYCLKTMDEDLAEAADDGDHPYEDWLWPLTGEVYWQGVYERDREERYRMKMDKKRKVKEKLLDRMKNGYNKQKSLGGR